jgi:hypothetical protein
VSVPFSVHASRTSLVLRRAFIAASAAWAAALPISVYAATHLPPSLVLAAIVGMVYAVGSVVCHQLPARSFHLWGAQMPVCARCAGIYAGAAVAPIVPYVASAFRRTLPALRRMVRPKPDTTYDARLALLVGALPTIATLAYEWTTGVMPSNSIRAIAGFPLGAAVAAIVLSAPDDQVN